jgi:1-acyl-sn-glycerol-3-phosphate acyltransferase
VYALLRAVAGVALRWYYRDIHVEGMERVPRHRPLLLVVNHPNALVDALLVGWILPRRVLITAKSTLFKNPLANILLRWLGVLPLHRTSDAASPADLPNPLRNRDTFRAVHAALGAGGCVLIFPEGKTHDEPSLAPLKTGAARIALQARAEVGDDAAAGRDTGRLRDLAIVPIGLTFERKDAPRSRVLVQIGEPILVDSWQPATDAPVEALTAEIDTHLRAVTANYSTADDATRAVRLAALVAALYDARPEARARDRTLAVEAAIARRIDALAHALEHADDAARDEADRLVRRLDAVEGEARAHGVTLEDAAISLAVPDAARFVVREGWLLLVGGPVALWGRINHWLPFRAARAVAMRSIDSAADPAMRTLLAGIVFVLASYVVQTIIVGLLFGHVVALVYLVSLPLAAEINFWLSERMRRVARRATTYLVFRRHPELQLTLEAQLAALRADVMAFNDRLVALGRDDASYNRAAGGGR